LEGTVLAVQANFYFVQVSRSEAGPTTLLCTRRTRLKKIGQTVMVGDRVVVEEADWAGNRGAIGQVLPRTSQLDRPPIANANQILLVFALEEPSLDPYQLTRFLVKAESTALAVRLCLSKCDLVAIAQQQWRQRLHRWGYEPVLISTYEPQGLEELYPHLQGNVTVVSGPSGVGKSSLINHLIPEANLRVSAVSGKLGRGRHTTRHVELLELPMGGLLADTPGFNQPDLDCLPEQLGSYFPEIRQRLAIDTCQFGDCWHRDEPGCVVRGDWERYEWYLLLLQEVLARHSDRLQRPQAEATLKQKVQGKYEVSYEPRLDSKKYRRESRRSRRQAMQDLQGNVEDLLDSEG
jgi:ribosome biogenesis GTPase